ncbi:AhpD-like protein [Sordaria brevicollis]|uniref:AhpD-like protein n=1 Tax=Sordaria brevicollis TaxID=83679 RepID=A0AAE0PN33_SORBR|nr:AhpD-like protein [Sordaria brevicollis]
MSFSLNYQLRKSLQHWLSPSSRLTRPLINTTRPFTTTPTTKMRLPYVPNPPNTTSEAEQAIVDRITARRHPRPLQPLDLTLLHSPPVADGWNSFLGAIRTQTLLPADERELAISRVAVCNGAWYEWHHHAPLAVQAGVSEGEDGLGVVKRQEPLLIEEGAQKKGGLNERQWAAVCLTDEMTRNVKVRDSTFEEVRKLFSEREMVELTAIIACYNCVSRFLVALDVGERNGTGPDDKAH